MESGFEEYYNDGRAEDLTGRYFVAVGTEREHEHFADSQCPCNQHGIKPEGDDDAKVT